MSSSSRPNYGGHTTQAALYGSVRVVGHLEFPTLGQAHLKWRPLITKRAGADAESELRVQCPGPQRGTMLAIYTEEEPFHAEPTPNRLAGR